MSLYDIIKYRIDTANKMPVGPHFAIIAFEPYSIHHEGDERSRTHPGHGYPAHTESGVHSSYYVLPDRDTWVAALKKLEFEKLNRNGYSSSNVAFKGIEVASVAKLETEVIVK